MDDELDRLYRLEKVVVDFIKTNSLNVHWDDGFDTYSIMHNARKQVLNELYCELKENKCI